MVSSLRLEGLLRQLNLLSQYYDLAPDEPLLEMISRAFHSLTLQAYVPAAEILQRGASSKWLPTLHRAWNRIDEHIRLDQDYPNQTTTAPDLVLAAFAVATALGACAAKDTSYRDFAADEHLTNQVATLEEQRTALIEQYNKKVEEYRQVVLPELVRQAPEQLRRELETKFSLSRADPQRRDLEYELQNLNQEISSLGHRIESHMAQVRDDFSPGYLMLRVLNQDQRYGVGVRQAAALGLHLLLQDGHLDAHARQKVSESLAAAIAGEAGKRFRERQVHALVNSSRTEFTQKLQEGIQWMSQIIPGYGDGGTAPTGGEEKQKSFFDLRTIIEMGCERVPGTVKFFERYPLRLMCRNDHMQLLGLYAKTGCAIEHWTRYVPPRDVGKVIRRYLMLDDRSLPNSMGIYFQLFQHPVLALPVLYHEYLHHTGVAGNGHHPILNETEVLLREVLFTRCLIAWMAPDDDQRIPDYERSLVAAIENMDMQVLLFLLLTDLSDKDLLLHINEQIHNTYGGGLSRQAAEHEADQRIAQVALNTLLANILQTWDSQVEWPLIGSKETEELTSRYREILVQNAMRDNVVQPHELDAILNGQSSQEDRES